MSSVATDRVGSCVTDPDSGQPFALSPGQTALWYAQRIRPDIPLTIAHYVELHGDLDVGRLLYANERYGAESQVGHVRLLEIDGQPYQRVDMSHRPGWARMDLRAETDPRAAALAWMNSHASSPIDMENDSLTINVVLRVGDREWYWYQRGHHIIIDGYGAMNALTRTAEIYTAIGEQREPSASRAAALVDLYAEQSRYAESSRMLADQKYWTEQLAGVGEPMTLSSVTAPGDTHTAERYRATAVLSDEVDTLLADAISAHNSANSALIVAALAAYVRSITGDADVVLSLPVSARTTMALRRSAGVVSNVVPLRVRFSDHTSVGDVIRQVELAITGALRHQRYRSDDIRRDCGYSRDARGFFGPMVNIMLFHDELRFDDIAGQMHVLATGPVEDLSINIYNGDGGRVQLDFEANPKLYAEAEVTAHHERYLDFLARFLAADAATPASELIAATDAEQQRVLREWNATETAVAPATLVSAFEDQVRRSPHAVALEFGNLAVGYTELSDRVNQLARELISRGVGPETTVGLCLHRSTEMVIGMYAILAAGAAYLPLDPEHPADRIEAVVSQAKPVCVLTAARDAVRLPDGVARVELDLLDVTGHASSPITDADRLSPLLPSQLAYVIFTSGSTGKPKGVGITHAAIINRLRWMQAEYPLDHTDAVLQKTPATFDVSVWEFFWPLQVGARLVVAAPDGHRDPAYLARIITEKAITTAHFVPSMLSLFVTDPRVAGGARLRRVFCSGEALPGATVTDFYAALHVDGVGPELHNLYGPTEAAVDVTYWPCPPDATTVPIGSPVWNTQTYVLDAHLRPAAPGVTGELYLAGVQLARGYLGRPDLTADRFVANPFSPGERMYRTGDLARWQLDGAALEYLGRTDFQVKIRGLRIELGEIEAALLADPGLARAVCVARAGRTGDDELVAYVVAAPGAATPDLATLMAGLRRALPSYMVPSALVILDELPLSANGKVDRKALPAPEEFQTGSVGATKPTTETERVLAEIMTDVLALGDTAIGIDDSFFDLGGNSLIAARAIARVNATFETALTIRDLFEAPTIAELAATMGTRRPDATTAKLVPAVRPARIPLSLAQQRLWILNRFAEHAAAYNMPLGLRLTGRLDPVALRAGLRDVLDRHESLRTSFPEADDGPYQLIHPTDAVDLTLDAVDVIAADIPVLAAEVAGRGFDLRTETPLRVVLYRVGHNDHLLLVVLHHISGDGWSVAPLARDLMVAVAARAEDAAPEWVPLPVQYADFALWQREILGSETDPESPVSKQLSHWAGALAGLPDQLDLPFDRPRPLRRDAGGDTVAFTIAPDIRRAASELAAARGVSMFMVLHAALATLLARVCGASDITIGTPIAGRSDPALDDLVGMFVNTLVLRTQVDLGAGFDRMLDVTREADLDAFANPDVPFERLVELVNPDRTTSRHPLFQVMLSYDHTPELKVELPGVTAELVPITAGVAKFDLQLEVSDATGDGPLHAEFGFATDVFDRTTVEALARRFTALLGAAVLSPETPVGDHELLDRREIARFVPIAGAPAEPAATLARLLSDTAQRMPDGVAVRYLGFDTTYRELDERSNRLARMLIAHGAAPETVVAVALPRSVESIVAIWAVAKTGAAYVPVDPAYPSDRIEHMIADSRASLGLTQPEHVAALPDHATGRHRATPEWLVFGTAEFESECAANSASPLADADRRAPMRASQPAYLIYTSGSTGKPKAVVVTHAGIASLASEQTQLFRVTDAARTMHFSSPSFDASVLELLLGFAAGATVVVAPADLYGGAELAAFLRSERITHAFITPAALATVPVGEFPDLGTVIVGGEACPDELVAAWAVKQRMHNMYGPSEATVAVTASAAMTPGEPVPLGGPVRGMRLFALDARMRPVSPGTPGELYVSGPGLARGYLGKADLTAQRFVANPHGRTGERMYRTGDLVVADAHGRLRFLGRADDQVKIRGFRIELREIDHVLREHPSVATALTIVHIDSHGQQRLASYVTASGPVDPAEVIATARGRLPGYMVPAAVTVLDALPVTPAGKVDRKALPAPEFAPVGGSRAPRTHLELRVAAVFTDVLGKPVPGAEDSFFDIGGNSLLATRLAAALHADFDVDLPVRQIFDAPTVAGIARLITEAPRTHRVALAVHTPRPGRIPLSLPQQRLWFLNRLSPESSAYNIAFVLRIGGDLNITALRAALVDLVERHEVLRTVFPEDLSGPQQVVMPLDRAPLDITVVDTDADNAHADLVGLARQGFDLTRETPLRVRLLRTARNEYLLGVVVHHIAADGWSLGPLTRDLALSYVARCGGIVPARPALPVQYADFSLWQRAVLGSEDDPDSIAATQLAHWRSVLADLPDELPLPFDRPRVAEPTGEAGTVVCAVSMPLQHALDELAHEAGVSLFMVLRSALAVLLRGVTGGRDIPIGTPVAGRTDIKLDDLVGMFVNTLVLRSDVDPDQPFIDLIHVDRDTELAALANADIPFERVVDALGRDRGNANRHPLFQVALSMQDDATPVLELPGLRLAAEELDIALAKFDLELRVAPAAQGRRYEFIYSAELFDVETIETLSTRFVRLLTTITADPRQRIRDLDLLTVPERRALVPAQGPAALSPVVLADIIARAADRFPTRPALRWFAGGSVAGEVGELDYAAVADRANRLGRALIERGIGTGDLVAVGLTRSLDCALAIFGVAASGAAFVPVDPRYPADRVRHMLTDSRAVAVITSRADVDGLRAASANLDARWLLTDDPELHAELATYSGDPVTDSERLRPIRPADVAYQIYTSGSTGLPKGVCVTHTGLASLALDMHERLGVDRFAKTLFFSTPSFDASVLDMMLAVYSGAEMVVGPIDVYGGDELGALLDKEQITHTFLTPAVLASIDTERWPLPHLRGLMAGGEAVPPDLVANWAPGRRFMNVYGPTEFTVLAVMARVDVGEPVAIGTPVRGARALVLDDQLRPVVTGVPGELYLGGPSVAQGYHQQFGLTAARFIADPCGPAGARIYRTGDVVRWTRDGQLEYLGRSDHQVKVRGFRIELGEITAVLGAHPLVRFAHTEVRRFAGDDRIVAWVQLATDTTELASVRDHAAAHLAGHMVPASFTILDEVPLTPVGKLDRTALPEPEFAASAVGRVPGTASERLVARVISELVGTQGISATDSFFDIGGNSLLATQLVARLAAASNVRLEVRTVFASPTVEELASLIDSGPSGVDARPELVKQLRPERIPLSAAQRRLLFLNRFNEGDTASAGAYNIPVVLRLHGAIDLSALIAALHTVQRRHETLRTVFPDSDGEPEQLILDPDIAAITLFHASARPQEVDAAVARFAAPGFDLAATVPMRAALITVDNTATMPVAMRAKYAVAGSTEHVLVLVVHHAAMDGWSLEPLAGEFAMAYRALRAGESLDEHIPEIQYADYTLWQRDLLGTEDDPDSVAAKQLSHWQTALDGLPELLAVPADRPRPPVPSYRGGTVDNLVDAATHRALHTIATANNVSMFMVLHAALAVLLHRVTGVDDIAVGTATAGRGHPALDAMIGMFVNTLVLRTEVTDEVAFMELLRGVRDHDLDAFANADVPFERLVEVLNPARSQAHHPLFQVMLSVRSAPVRMLELPGLRIEAVEHDAGIAKFDLQFTFTENHTADRVPDGIELSVNYAADLFDEVTARRLGDRLGRLLTAVAADPNTAVGDLALLDAVEWTALAPVRGARADRPVSFPEVFRAAVVRSRDGVALSSGDTVVTYDALDRWTNRLARVLIGRGIGPESLVALGVPRSVESVATMLAVAKAGAAFVPVDPNYPPQRISHMLADSGAELGLTLLEHHPRLPGDTHWLVLDEPRTRAMVLGTDDAPITDAERVRPLRIDNPAYVIYTSGSTGTPKGVVVTHGGLSNFAAETAERFDVRPGSRILHFATPSFDAALLDILFALGGGATLVISPQGVVGGEELREVFITERITHAFITTAALGTVDPAGVHSLAHILVGGEALPPDLLERWAPGRNFYNVYGPTETTIVTLMPQAMAPNAPITIGGPIRDVAATVLDKRLHPTPIGVTGELQLAGSALARGYLNRPGLTAQRFVANPYGAPGERMYRTGDLVRWRDGAKSALDVEYVGRTDHQVKVRGFRIELGEIDAAFGRHTDVEFALTIGHHTAAGVTALVSYVKPRAGSAVTVAELLDHVSGHVPNYMVPQAVMLLDDVPLTPVGKLDRARLPEPVFASTGGYRAPVTPTEMALCAAFSEVLGVERVGADDGFFELGGNSLLATKVVAALRDQGIEMPVQVMFGDATPSAIATKLDGTDAGAVMAAALAPVLPIRATNDPLAKPLFCVHPAIGLSWCYAGLLAHLAPERPVYGLQAPHVSGGVGFATIPEAAAAYIDHIRSIQPTGPYHLLGWSLGGLIAQEIAVQLQDAGHEVAVLAMLDSYQLGDRWLDTAMPSVADIIGEFGADLLDGATLPADLDLSEAAELLRSQPGPFAALSLDNLRHLYTGYADGTVMANHFRPRVFDGDLLFFTATADEINAADPDRNAQAWQPFVTGTIHNNDLPCRHSGMTSPESLAVIGPVLHRHLDAVPEITACGSGPKEMRP
ncbi:amino acid adenylation domain-containing protein [Nocardia camponoti]|uniref:Carrier domain-containing protein n=1 Tax=Nocardia camponoti TaxID=1616106 RepID=A0A917Q9N5_9NOCA|nr:non-ribosomal peptide synthetase [Nocardia camponoti]GGK36819.1 hypothetical protein GCM10011591_05620 [Nocardia camponoti]